MNKKLKALEQEKEKADRRIAEQDAKLNAADAEVCFLICTYVAGRRTDQNVSEDRFGSEM